ncbi:MAG: hypothetical protein N3E38_03040 [Candidatus Aenigmarchaeota archaeon]|nr:hypothetical protein [Candidatus Aenigmarchaeota archaeon]
MNGDVWGFVIILIITIVLPVIIILIANAGPNFWNVIGNVIAIAYLSLLFLLLSGGFIILGVIIAYRYPRVGRILSYIGIGGVLLGLLFLEVSVAATTAKNRLGQSYILENCKQIPVIIGEGIKSISDTISCIITGYYSKDASPYYLIGYWIFGVAIPLLITSGIFIDLVESSGVIQNRLSRRLIGWGLGFLAYRGLVVSNLIYIIDFASAGMAVIALNFIFVGGLLAYTNRIFSQWQSIEDSIKIGKSTRIARVKSKRLLEEAIKMAQGGTPVDDIFNKFLLPYRGDFEIAGPSGWLAIESAKTECSGKPNPSECFGQKLREIRDRFYR